MDVWRQPPLPWGEGVPLHFPLYRGRTWPLSLSTPSFVVAGLDPAIHSDSHRRMGEFYVYILASKKHGTLYIGVTNNIARRVYEHRIGTGNSFTRRYGVFRLVWYEAYPTAIEAIQRETSLKKWPRRWKVDLIERDNPNWFDLYRSLNR